MTREIPLSMGYVALVDDEDYGRISAHSWYALKQNGRVYAYYKDRVPGRNRIIYMHREILDAPAGVRVDHKNRRTLDNRRDNLRFATRSQNGVNCITPMPHGYRGIKRSSQARVAFEARLKANGKFFHLGTFETAEEAARAYDAAALTAHGEFAVLNFPPSPR